MSLVNKRWILTDPNSPNAVTAFTFYTSGGQNVEQQLPKVRISNTDTTSGFLAEKLIQGDNIVLTENVAVDGTQTLTVSMPSISENLIATGNVLARLAESQTVTGNWTFSNALTLNGDLVVNGTTVTANATTVTVDDPVVKLGGDTAPTLNDGKDRGVEFNYFDTAAKLGFMGYDNSAGKFTLLTDATNSGESFSGVKAELDAHLDYSNLLNVPAAIQPSDLLTELLKVDGAASGLDSQFLAGNAASYYTNASNLSSGTVSVARLPAFIGDATSTAGDNTLTLTNSGVTAGVYNGSATQTQSFTVDAKGRVTAVGSAITITPAFTSITSLPTTIAGFGITNAYTKTEMDTSLAGKAALAGSAAQDFNVKNLTFSGDILPTTTQLFNIGSPTQRVKGIYVDEAHLSVNTLYLGTTAILGTSQDTVNIHADINQSISIITTGTGATTLTSERGVTISTSGVTADVNVQTSGLGSKVRFTSATAVELTSASIKLDGESTLTGNAAVGGNLTVTGNFTVNGTTTTVNSTTVTTRDNIIVVNQGEVGTGVTSGKAGLQVDRGDDVDYQLVFDETDDMFKVGMIGALQTVATREWINASYSTSTHTHVISNITGLQLALDGKLNTGDNAVSSSTSAKLTTSRTISTTGDATWSVSFDGSANVASSLTLADSGVSAGTYNNSATQVRPFTVDAKGRVVAVGTPVTITPAFASITALPSTLAGFGITDGATSASVSSHVGDTSVHLTSAQNTWLDTITVSATEVNYLSGVSSDIQTQLTARAIAANTYTKTETDQLFTDLVGGAPLLLNTINELSAALGNDANFATTITNTLASKAPINNPTFTGVVYGITPNMIGLGNVDNVKQLAHTQTLAFTGDATASATSLNTGTIAITLANSGVTSGNYNNVTVDAKGRVTSASADVILADAVLTSKTFSSASITANQVAATFDASVYRSIKLVAQTTAGAYHATTELLLIHDGSTVTVTEYGTLNTGSALATFTADINAGQIRILVTPTTGGTTVKLLANLVKI